jgi:hypothetical protein
MASNIITDERRAEINDVNYLYKCTKCNVLKPNSEYAKDNKKGRGRGYVTQCKKCRASYKKNELSEESKKISRKKQNKKHRLSVIFNSSKGNAKKRQIEHSISIDYLEELWNSQNGLCYYTKKPMLKDLQNIESNYDSVSIDRIDSSLGYVEGNVVLCRWVINRMKNDLSNSYFLETISEIYKNFNL